MKNGGGLNAVVNYSGLNTAYLFKQRPFGFLKPEKSCSVTNVD